MELKGIFLKKMQALNMKHDAHIVNTNKPTPESRTSLLAIVETTSTIADTTDTL